MNGSMSISRPDLPAMGIDALPHAERTDAALIAAAVGGAVVVSQIICNATVSNNNFMNQKSPTFP